MDTPAETLGIPIELPNRVFLDCWILKRASQGEWPDAVAALRTEIDQGRAVLVVTGDHISDYGDCTADEKAMAEACFVDTLHPLWMLPGVGIYHREASSEYLRLTGREPLPAPFPTRTASESFLQWSRDCQCCLQFRDFVEALQSDNDPTFSGKLRGGFQGDTLGLAPGFLDRRKQKDEFCACRTKARAEGWSELNLDRYFRREWVRYLTDLPAQPPKENVPELAAKVDFSRMPAWAAWMGVERVWHRGRARGKRSDLVDIWHLALLPYVDVFVTEKHLAEMIRQAKLRQGPVVHSDLREWLGASLREPETPKGGR